MTSAAVDHVAALFTVSGWLLEKVIGGVKVPRQMVAETPWNRKPLVLSHGEHHRATSVVQLASVRRTTPSCELAGEAGEFSSIVYSPIPI
ncbi:hypothetical protein VNO80_27234 [Phaseolus coccineus]|uniref:Uncharacterized protein n=1 Tax=Phaseolus coccineus TaxID=3886 RepID=A0AAN9LGW2_PHACN